MDAPLDVLTLDHDTPAARRYPVAIGLVSTTECASAGERLVARLRLSLAANERGYELMHLFEVGADQARDQATYSTVQRLARLVRADALLVSGPLDRHRLHALR